MASIALVFPSVRFRRVVEQLGGDASIAVFGPGLDPDDVKRICFEAIGPETDVVAVGPEIDISDALRIVREIDRQFPRVSVLLVAKPTADLWQAALHAGARDIVDPEADADTVAISFERAFDLASERRASARNAAAEPSIETRPMGRIVVTLSPKGGSGKTVVSTNLGVLIARRLPGDVALVDLDLQFGDVASSLGLTPSYTMYTATQASGSEASILRAFLTPHESQLLVLCAPDDPTEADDVKEGDAARIIVELARMFPWVLVDTGAGLDDLTLSMAELATDLILVTSTDVPSVRGVRKEAAILDQLGVRAARHLVLNRADAKVGLSPKDIADTIGLDISAEIPSSRSIPSSVNAGQPIVDMESRGAAAKGLTALANQLLATPGQGAKAKSWRGFLR